MPDRGVQVPLAHIVLGLLLAVVFDIGGEVTFGSWGSFDVRTALAFVLPAIALHGWSGLGKPRLWPRAAAWLLLFAMAYQVRVLLQPEFLGSCALLAGLDLALHARRVPRSQASVRAKVVAGLAALAAVGVLAALVQFATFEALTRLGAATLLLAALVIAAALRKDFRAPQRLLPAMGAYYLAFVLLAAPVLPFGAALAWWLLCGGVFVAVAVAARHVSGADVPKALRKHEHVVRRLPDDALGAASDDVARFLASGAGAPALAARVRAATGRDPEALLAAASPEDREQALRFLLEC